MTHDETPIGQRFSLLYVERTALLQDSPRFRSRLLSWFDQNLNSSLLISWTNVLEQEIGVRIRFTGHYDFRSFFEGGALADVLDAITVIHRVLTARHLALASSWLQFCSRVIKEENLGYRIDTRGGVHPLVDEEFERSRVAALAGLNGARYAAVRDAFEAGHAALEADPADTKGCIRSGFEAVEILFKLMAPGVPRLGTSEIQKHLVPILDRHYKANETASRVAIKQASALAHWVEGMHFYRHGQETEEPAPPPIEIAVLALSTAAGYLRWLIDIDVARPA